MLFPRPLACANLPYTNPTEERRQIHDRANHTVDGESTLTDSQVLEFCREGYLLLKGVVADEINRST